MRFLPCDSVGKTGVINAAPTTLRYRFKTMTRTFIALEMNESLQRHLGEVIRQVAQVLPDVRWVDPRGIHLTLAFLGELDDAQLQAAMLAAENAAKQCQSFSFSLNRLGIFGSPRSPRVIWMGIDEPSGGLNRLHSILNQELAQRGFAIDTRPFSPHLTLARIKIPLRAQEQQRLQQLLASKQQGIISTEQYPVQHIEVIKSELSRNGAHYTVLKACSLSS